MAFSIIYRRIFEVRLYHGYELNDPDNFFGLSENGKANEIIETNYDISKYLMVKPTEECQRILKRHRLIFKTTPTGFFVASKVRPSDAGANIYRPAIHVGANTVFDFRLIPVENHWSDITNVRFQPNFSSKYFFSNYQNLTDLTFPSLALPPNNHNSSIAYEMGDIVRSGGGIFQALSKIEDGTAPNSPNFWESIQNKLWATNQDRRLVPSKFVYHFLTNDGTQIQTATIELRDLNDNVVRAIQVNEINPIQQILLDFGENNTNAAVPSGEYNLVINSSGYQTSHLIKINDELFGGKRRSNEFGIVSIGHLPSLGAFRLIEDNGDLRTETGQTETPVFEIRMKNRATYRAYILHGDDDETQFPATADFVKTDRTLTTVNVIPLSRFYAGLEYETGLNFPDPSNLLINRTADGNRWLSEIYLPRLKN